MPFEMCRYPSSMKQELEEWTISAPFFAREIIVEFVFLFQKHCYRREYHATLPTAQFYHSKSIEIGLRTGSSKRQTSTDTHLGMSSVASIVEKMFGTRKWDKFKA
ncbi:hypothetical protein TNCV_2524891 [Trichonephila clavipes]|nr:hypothetical protein TNCV_2524891 [Trichonephila clavipes]